MKREFRLTRSTDFKRVRRLGKSYAHPLIVLVALPSAAQPPRVAVAAGRSVGQAVARNRAKRLLREAIRPYLAPQGQSPTLLSGWDLILIARQPLAQAKFSAVQAALLNLLQRAHLLSLPGNDRPSEPHSRD